MLIHYISVLILRVERRAGGDTVEKFLSVREVSELFGVTETTVRRWVMENKIPSCRIGGARRFNYHEVINYITKGVNRK